MWQTINKVLDKSSKSKMHTSLIFEGKRLNRENDKVQALNQHFVSVETKLADQIVQNSNDDPLKHIVHEESSICFSPVNSNYVLKAIQLQNNGKSLGPDKIPLTLIKDAIDIISPPLNDFQLFLEKGSLP